MAKPGTLRLADYFDRWLSDVAAPRVRTGTLTCYKRAGPRAQLGGVSLRALSPMAVSGLLAGTAEAGVSARGCQMTYVVLRTAL